MLNLAVNENTKQVYTTDRAELVRFLEWWKNLKSVGYIDNYFIKEVDKNGVTYYYSDFFGVYFEYVTQEIIDDFYRNRKGALIAKIEKNVETIKGARL
jgi:hypothetical protein